jgi:5-methylcytosine-specific restriction endonuclease McrA
MTRPPRETYAKPQGWTTTKAANMRRDRRICQSCGAKATEIDHIVPVSQGGSHEPDNLRAICRDCHRRKTHAETVAGVRRFHGTRKRPTAPHPGDVT